MSKKVIRGRAFRLSVALGILASPIACATFDEQEIDEKVVAEPGAVPVVPGRTVEEIMHDVGSANRRTKSDDTAEAYAAAVKMGVLARELQEPGSRFDDGEFVRLAKLLETTSMDLQVALNEMGSAEAIEAARDAQAQSCRQCHAIYR